MLDVHPPHKAIHGLGEFFLHLFTITVGLLIAVGIEAGVERHHHNELANQAQETLNTEIRKNEAAMKTPCRGSSGNGGKRCQPGKHLQGTKRCRADANVDVSYSSTGLEETAWRTAQETGALTYMPYDKAERHSSIYNAVRDFEAGQARLAEDEAQVLGTIRRYGVGKGKMSKEAANAFAERLGVSQGHLLTLWIIARVLEDEQSAFLAGREPTHHMSESLGN